MRFRLQDAAAVALMCAALYAWYARRSPVAPIPDRPISPDLMNFDASLTPLFAGNPDGKRDARRIAGQLDALADAIGRDGTLASPQLAHVASVYDLWKAAVASAMDGERIVDSYPAFGPAVKKVITAAHPDSNATLDGSTRTSVVAIFEAAAEACRKVGE